MDAKPATPTKNAVPAFTPAISVRKSLSSSAHILSMIDGKPYRTLRRHLSAHGLTPDSYRARYDLPADYPTVAPDYSAHRSALAKQIALGRKRRSGTLQSEDGPPARECSVVAPDTAEAPSSASVEAAANTAASMSACTVVAGPKNASRTSESEAANIAEVSADESFPTDATTPPELAAITQPQAIAREAEATESGRRGSGAPEVARIGKSLDTATLRRTKLSLFSKPHIEAKQEQSVSRDVPSEPARADQPHLVPAAQLSTGRDASSKLRAATTVPGPPEKSDQPDPAAEVSSTRLILIEAIARRRAVTAIYNGAMIKLSPHQLFQRNDDLFLTAVNASKKWRVDEEKRLGQFKLAGLKGVKLLEEEITPLPSFNIALPRADDSLVLSI